MKPYRFTQNNGGHFQLVVFAKSKQKAINYVKRQAISSLAHRALRFVGEGHPSNPENWVAATVREGY